MNAQTYVWSRGGAGLTTDLFAVKGTSSMRWHRNGRGGNITTINGAIWPNAVKCDARSGKGCKCKTYK